MRILSCQVLSIQCLAVYSLSKPTPSLEQISLTLFIRLSKSSEIYVTPSYTIIECKGTALLSGV